MSSLFHLNHTSSELPNIYIGRLASSPIGPLWVAVSSQGVCMVEWEMPEADITKLTEQRYHVRIIHDESRTLEAINQLVDYLNGTRCQFSLALDFSGMSSFQENVLRLTSQIPYGETRTYKEIAVQIGKENAARAVGRVEATNPMPLIIPCHRVLGSDGTLHGYGGPGGIKLKAWLLELEKSPLK